MKISKQIEKPLQQSLGQNRREKTNIIVKKRKIERKQKIGMQQK